MLQLSETATWLRMKQHARGPDEPNKDRGLISDNISPGLRLHAALLLTEISPLKTS